MLLNRSSSLSASSSSLSLVCPAKGGVLFLFIPHFHEFHSPTTTRSDAGEMRSSEDFLHFQLLKFIPLERLFLFLIPFH